jgi:hypothetical protein
VLRITELSLPLDADTRALRSAIVRRLKMSAAELLDFTVYRRSFDARKKNSSITFVYVIDLVARDEAAILERFAGDPNVRAAPDTNYYPVGRAPTNLSERPVIVGFGPCGLFAALLLAQMGFKPIVLERGPEVRRRTGYLAGAERYCRPNRTCSLAKAAPVCFRMKLCNQIRPVLWPQGTRGLSRRGPGRNHVREQTSVRFASPGWSRGYATKYRPRRRSAIRCKSGRSAAGRRARRSGFAVQTVTGRGARARHSARYLSHAPRVFPRRSPLLSVSASSIHNR